MECVSAAHVVRRGPFFPIQNRNFLSEGLCLSLNLSQTSVVDAEYIILENIYDSTTRSLRQRDLAQTAGASLGMTNAILKRLAKKGWITIKKLNSRNIQYAVTIEGINEIIHRSYRYFKRTIRNVVYYKDLLEDLVNRARRRNVNAVILVGRSDLDFIVEHACRRCGMNFTRVVDDGKTAEAQISQALIIYAEGIHESSRTPVPSRPTENQAAVVNRFYLSRLIIKQAAKGKLGEIARN